MRPCSDQSHLQFQVFTRRGRHKEQLLCLAFQFEFSLHDVRSLEDLGKYVLGYLTCRADPFRRLQSWKLLLFYSLVTGLRGRSCSPIPPPAGRICHNQTYPHYNQTIPDQNRKMLGLKKTVLFMAASL